MNKAHLNMISFKYPDLFKKLMDKCDIIKIDMVRPRKITFIECIDFDADLNPVIKAWYSFKFERGDNQGCHYLGKRLNSVKNPLILHRKEEMVDSNYRGFSRHLAESWTKLYIYKNSRISDFAETSKIGRKIFWDNCIEQLKKKNSKSYNEFIKNWLEDVEYRKNKRG